MHTCRIQRGQTKEGPKTSWVSVGLTEGLYHNHAHTYSSVSTHIFSPYTNFLLSLPFKLFEFSWNLPFVRNFQNTRKYKEERREEERKNRDKEKGGFQDIHVGLTPHIPLSKPQPLRLCLSPNTSQDLVVCMLYGQNICAHLNIYLHLLWKIFFQH